jgi:hypothetical protein
MAKKKPRVTSGERRENPTLNSPLSTLNSRERCRAAFASQARAQVDVDGLTAEEIEAFAAIVDEFGEPCALDVDGAQVPGSRLAEHQVPLAQTAPQRFTEAYHAYLTRIRREAAERKALLDKQRADANDEVRMTNDEA